jgi:PAS domain-containing protein
MVKTQAFTLPLDMTTFPCVLMAENFQIKTMNPAMIKFLNLSRHDDLNDRLLMDYISEEDQNTFFDLLSSKEKPDTDQRWEVITFTSTDGSKRNILINISNTLQLSKNANAYFLVGMPLSNVDRESISVDPTNLSIPIKLYSNKYKSIFENAPFGIMILDQQGNVEESNPTFDKHFGISRKLQTKWHYAYSGHDAH